MIHVFHGFLGSQEDFSFLKKDGVLLHDLYDLQGMPTIREDDTLIGYSMGGRIALEIALANHYRLKKLILINAHPGLQSDEERAHRLEFEEKVIQKLNEKSKDDFLMWWNELPLFQKDYPISMTEDRFKKSRSLFERFRLSKRPNYLPSMIENKEKILYIVGLWDKKYLEFSEKYLIPHHIRVKGLMCGHRAFQHHEELKKIFIEEGVL